MSDEMMLDIAKMPYEMAMQDELSRYQFYMNTQRLVAALEAARAEVERLAEMLRELEGREQRDEDLLRQALEALAYWLEVGETPGSHDIIQRTHDALQERLGENA